MKFQDRISEYPGRIKLTDENGEAHYYTLERADEPTQVGTPLSAENLNKLTQDVNGKTGASIVLTGDDIAISASDNTTVKERVDGVRSTASAAQNTATARETLAQEASQQAKMIDYTLTTNNNGEIMLTSLAQYIPPERIIQAVVIGQPYGGFFIIRETNLLLMSASTTQPAIAIPNRTVTVRIRYFDY